MVARVEQQLDLLLGEVDVDERSGAQWKARSQAANHGYSHLSGIEMTSPATMWNQATLRSGLAGAFGSHGFTPCSRSQRCTSYS